MIHHLLSDSDTDDWLKVNQVFVEQLASIAGKLNAIWRVSLRRSTTWSFFFVPAC